MLHKNIFYIVSSIIIIIGIILYNLFSNGTSISNIKVPIKDSSISKYLKKENFKVPEIKYDIPNENERVYENKPKEFVSDFDGKITKISSDEDRKYIKLHCHDSYLQTLKEKSKEGYRVYDIGKDKKGHKAFFFFWIKCEKSSKIMELTTAVHETVHKLTDDFDGYPQINGNILRRISETEKMMPIYKIRNKIKPYVSDMIYETYLSKKDDTIDSSTDMTLFFDEFNAFTYDIWVATQLTKENVNYSSRDGLTMFMVAFLEYIKHVKLNDDKTWKLLNSENGRKVVTTIWKQAEYVFNIACKYPHGFKDAKSIKYLQSKANLNIIQEFLNEKSNITMESCR